MKKITLYFIFFNSIILLFSCQQSPTISDIIESDFSKQFDHNKVIRDAKNSFEINIGKNWKRELYVDTNQSRIYGADTTRNYSSSFIIDITKFKGKIRIEDEFTDGISSQITKEHRTYMINQGAILFKKIPSYVFYSFQKNNNNITYSIECYVPDGESYYLLSAQINGSQNLTQNTAEIITIFNSLNRLP